MRVIDVFDPQAHVRCIMHVRWQVYSSHSEMGITHFLFNLGQYTTWFQGLVIKYIYVHKTTS